MNSSTFDRLVLSTSDLEVEDSSSAFEASIGFILARFGFGCFAAIDGGSFSVPSYSRARIFCNRGATMMLPYWRPNIPLVASAFAVSASDDMARMKSR